MCIIERLEVRVCGARGPNRPPPQRVRAPAYPSPPLCRPTRFPAPRPTRPHVRWLPVTDPPVRRPTRPRPPCTRRFLPARSSDDETLHYNSRHPKIAKALVRTFELLLKGFDVQSIVAAADCLPRRSKHPLIISLEPTQIRLCQVSTATFAAHVQSRFGDDSSPPPPS